MLSLFLRYWSQYGLASAIRQTRKWFVDAKPSVRFADASLLREFVSSEDLLRTGELVRAPVLEVRPQSDEVLWIVPPFSSGSGGMASISNIVRAQQALGLSPRLLVYSGDSYISLREMRRLASDEYNLPEVEIVSTDQLDRTAYPVVVATGWQSAYGARKISASKHYYLVQDFEPDFYPAGTLREMALQTYLFGFEMVTIGPWLPLKLKEILNLRAIGFPLPYDSDVFNFGSRPIRKRQLVCYHRPGTPRRLSEIAVGALQILEMLAPREFEIHLVGAGLAPKNLVSITQHEHLNPHDVADLLSQSTDALVLSATNPSLFPKEAMACGVRVVTNDSEANRECLPDTVKFAPLSPRMIAEAILSPHNHTPDELAASVELSAWKFVGPELGNALF